jgi:hypothetical protein
MKHIFVIGLVIDLFKIDADGIYDVEWELVSD